MSSRGLSPRSTERRAPLASLRVRRCRSLPEFLLTQMRAETGSLDPGDKPRDDTPCPREPHVLYD